MDVQNPSLSSVAYFISEALGAYVYPQHLGLVTHDPIGFNLPNSSGLVVFPDVAYVSMLRLPEPDLTQYPYNLSVAPELAVEIVSPDDEIETLMGQITAYFKAGTLLVWVIYIKGQFVQVYRGNIINVTGVGIDGALDGGDVLSGFSLPLRDIFRNVTS